MPAPTAPARPSRAEVVDLVRRLSGDEAHTAAASSTLDVLLVLYGRILRVDPHQPDHPDRDRFVLSKGHGPHALYATLAAHGFLPVEWLESWASFDSPLGLHPDRNLVPGVEISSGSLGHGLPIAVGMVLGLRARGQRGPRVIVLVGDAELDEGANHEAIALAGRLALHELTAVVVDNASSTHGWPGGIGARFAVEGWRARAVDGRDHDALTSALSAPPDGRPTVVVARVEPKR